MAEHRVIGYISEHGLEKLAAGLPAEIDPVRHHDSITYDLSRDISVTVEVAHSEDPSAS